MSRIYCRKTSISRSFFVCLMALIYTACTIEKTEITTAFDHGSLGPVKIIGDTLIKGQTMHWIKKDKIGNQYYWFYFKLSNVKDKKVTFEFDNMTGVYRNNLQEKFSGHTQPVFSYDQNTWTRITDTHYRNELKQFRFVQTFTQDIVWIAYAHPYSLNRHRSFLEKMKTEKEIQIEKIGESVLSNDINLITIPRYKEVSASPLNVLILACQHAGEDCAGYFTEGFIEELLSGSAKVKRVRENTSFRILPMMNPDGYYFGTSRYNYHMEDLNSEWDDDSSDSVNLPVEPEVRAVKAWYKKYRSESRIDLVVDIHSHGQDPRKCLLHSDDPRLNNLTKEMNKFWPVLFILKPSRGNCRGYFVKEENIPACTLELSQSDLNNGRPYLDIDDYKYEGRQMVYAIYSFLQN